MGEYLKEIWQSRNFIFLDARMRANANGRDTFLGKLWIVFDPLLQTAFYGFVFGVVLQVSRGMENFPGFLALGVIFFKIVTRGMSTGVGLVRRSRALISSFHFPRAAVPIGETLKNAFDGLVPAMIAVLLALAWQRDQPVSWTVLLVIPLFFLIQLFSLGCCFVIARATAFVPDLKSIVNLITRALFFLSGVFFSIERFVNHPELELAMKLNPVYQFLSTVRLVVLDGQVPSIGIWAYLCLWSVGLSCVGLVYFWAAEGRYASIR